MLCLQVVAEVVVLVGVQKVETQQDVGVAGEGLVEPHVVADDVWVRKKAQLFLRGCSNMISHLF